MLATKYHSSDQRPITKGGGGGGGGACAHFKGQKDSVDGIVKDTLELGWLIVPIFGPDSQGIPPQKILVMGLLTIVSFAQKWLTF